MSNNGFIYRLGSATNHLGKPPVFCSSALLHSAGFRFASVYAIREDDAEAIQEAGTAAGFQGIVWSSRLWTDFDDYESARAAQGRLKEMGLDHVVYDTGHRGMHIGILRNSNPSHTLPRQDKTWVQANLPGADLSLYWHLHLIRLPGTVHEKTGRVKTLIQSTEGTALTLPPYAPEEAQSQGATPSPKSETARASLFTKWATMSRVTEEQGRSRHRQLLELALAAKRECGLQEEETIWVVKEANRGYQEPKAEAEIEKLVRWVYSK